MTKFQINSVDHQDVALMFYIITQHKTSLDWEPSNLYYLYLHHNAMSTLTTTDL